MSRLTPKPSSGATPAPTAPTEPDRDADARADAGANAGADTGTHARADARPDTRPDARPDARIRPTEPDIVRPRDRYAGPDGHRASRRPHDRAAHTGTHRGPRDSVRRRRRPEVVLVFVLPGPQPQLRQLHAPPPIARSSRALADDTPAPGLVAYAGDAPSAG